jgi:hypothetical protein
MFANWSEPLAKHNTEYQHILTIAERHSEEASKKVRFGKYLAA